MPQEISFDVAQFCQYGDKVTFQKGDIITQSVAEQTEGDIYILKDGICALSSISFDGTETTYLYFKKQQFIGFVPLVSNLDLNYYGKKTFSIIAKTPCTAYHISARQFQELLGFPSFVTLMFHTLSENNVYLMEHFHSAKNEPAIVQLCRFLLDQADRTADQQLVLNRFFTYDEIAHYLGMHSVTIARMIKALKTEGMIAKNGHQICIRDVAKMTQLITEDKHLDY